MIKENGLSISIEGTSHIIGIPENKFNRMDVEILSRLELEANGLLQMNAVHEYDRITIYYEITSMIAIADMLHKKKFNVKEICRMLLPMIDLQEFLDSHLLDERNLHLSASAVYYDFKSDGLKFIYLPIRDINGVADESEKLVDFVKDLVFRNLNYSSSSGEDAIKLIEFMNKLKVCADMRAVRDVVTETMNGLTVGRQGSNLGSDCPDAQKKVQEPVSVLQRSRENENVRERTSDIHVVSGSFESKSKNLQNKSKEKVIKRKLSSVLAMRILVFMLSVGALSMLLVWSRRMEIVNILIMLAISGIAPFVFIKESKEKVGHIQQDIWVPIKNDAESTDAQNSVREDVFVKRMKAEAELTNSITKATEPKSNLNATQLVGRKQGHIALNPKDPSRGMIIVSGKSHLIGRSSDLVDHTLECDTIGRLHAEISNDASIVAVKDFNTLNGTFVNQQRVQPGERVQIQVGDTVRFADIEFVVCING